MSGEQAKDEGMSLQEELTVQVAIDNHKGGDDEEIYVLRRAARILR